MGKSRLFLCRAGLVLHVLLYRGRGKWIPKVLLPRVGIGTYTQKMREETGCFKTKYFSHALLSAIILILD